MNDVSRAGFGCRFLLFSALATSEKLNTWANNITLGSVNRDKLAERVVMDTAHLGLNMIGEQKMLGDRSAEIVDLARRILSKENPKQSTENISQLVDLLAEYQCGEVGRNLISVAKKLTLAKLVEADSPQKLLCAIFQEKEAQQILLTMLRDKLPKYFLVDFALNTLLTAISYLVTKKDTYQADNNLYKLSAEMLLQFLSKDGSTLKPLWAYARQCTQASYHGLRAITCQALDEVQQILNIPPAIKPLAEAYTGQTLPQKISPRLSSAAMSDLILLAETTQQQDALQERITELSPEKQQQWQQQSNQVAAVLKPLLGQCESVTVARNWSNTLSAINTTSGAFIPPLVNHEEELDSRFLNHAPWIDELLGYSVDGKFAQQLDKLDITIDTPEGDVPEKITGWSSWALKAGASLLGYSSISAEQRKLDTLNQLSHLMGGKQMHLLGLTRHLNAEHVEKSLRNLLNFKSVDIIHHDDCIIKVGEPQVKFNLNKGDGVNLDMQVIWPVLSFESADGKLHQQDRIIGSVTTEARINLHDNNGNLRENLTVRDPRIILENQLKFNTSLTTVEKTQHLTQRYLNGLSLPFSRFIMG